MRIWTYPPLATAQAGFASSPGGPNHSSLSRAKYLARLGVETVADRAQADLVHVVGVDCLPGTDVQTIDYIWPVHLYPDDAPGWWREQNDVMRQAIQQARVVVVNSGYMVREVERLAGVQARWIDQAIDQDEGGIEPTGYWRARLEAEDRPVVIWNKNAIDVLRDPAPATKLARMRPEAVVVLTAEAAQVERWLGHELPLNVRCVGRLPYPQMQALLAESDVYLATFCESSGLGHMEALYQGVPVIGYRWGGVADISGDVALLVELGDVRGLADALDQALANKAALGPAGRQLIERRHLWQIVAPTYKALYEELLS